MAEGEFPAPPVTQLLFQMLAHPPATLLFKPAFTLGVGIVRMGWTFSVVLLLYGVCHSAPPLLHQMISNNIKGERNIEKPGGMSRIEVNDLLRSIVKFPAGTFVILRRGSGKEGIDGKTIGMAASVFSDGVVLSSGDVW